MSKPFIEGGKEDLGFSIQIVVCYVLRGCGPKFAAWNIKNFRSI
jgi:hypothetical protein